MAAEAPGYGPPADENQSLSTDAPRYRPPLDDRELPRYSRLVAPNEHVLERQTQAAQPLSSDIEYEYESKTLKLNLGRKMWPTRVPSYGWNAIIEGWVEVKRWDHVSSITVSIEGTATSTLNERGMARYYASATILEISRRLYPPDGESRSSAPQEVTRFPFSFTLPSTIRRGTSALPPSYFDLHPGISGDVKYQVRADVVRKGFRRHEALKARVLYLPKTMPPQPSATVRMLGVIENRLAGEITWKQIPLKPLPIRFQNLITTQVSVQLALPLPTVYASFQPIHFVLTLSSSLGTLRDVMSRLSVSLVKYQKLSCGGQPSVRDVVIGNGEIWRVDENSEGFRILKGTVTSQKEAGEMSFRLPGFYEIKYAIRLRIDHAVHPPIPPFAHEEPITMTTHGWSSDAIDTNWPVMGLLHIRSGPTLVSVPLSSNGRVFL